MAAITSAQTGLRASTATWVGGVVPGDADNAIIADGHTVTNEGAWTIGNDVAATDAITLQGTGALVNNSDITCKGNMTAASGSAALGFAVVMGAGASWDWNSASTNEYGFFSEVYDATNAGWQCNGTDGSHCSMITTGSGVGFLRIRMSANPGNSGAAYDINYTDFSNMGSATRQTLHQRRGSMVMDHCTFDNCYRIGNEATYFYPEADVIITNCNFKNCNDTYDTYLSNQSIATVTGTRTVENTSFGNGVQLFYRWGEIGIRHCYMDQFSHTAQVSLADYVSDFDYNFIAGDLDFDVLSPIMRRIYRYSANADNNHPFIFGDLDDFTTLEFDRVIFEHGADWVTNEPDCILNNAAQTSALAVTLKNCLVLKNDGGRASGRFLTDNCGYAGNLNLLIYNNTFYSERGGVYLAHGTGEVGRMVELINNLAWSDAAPSAAHILSQLGDVIPINGYAAEVDYNSYNVVTSKYAVTAGVIAGTPGANDVDAVDPGFADSTRGLATWAETVLGKTGTAVQLRAAGLAAIVAMNDPENVDYDALATVQSLHDWVSAGYVPSNTSDLLTAGKGGTWIGALEPVASGSADFFGMIAGNSVIGDSLSVASFDLETKFIGFKRPLSE